MFFIVSIYVSHSDLRRKIACGGVRVPRVDRSGMTWNDVASTIGCHALVWHIDIPARMHVTCGCSGIDMEYINQYIKS